MLFNIFYILARVDSRKCEANDSYADKCQDHFDINYFVLMKDLVSV